MSKKTIIDFDRFDEPRQLTFNDFALDNKSIKSVDKMSRTIANELANLEEQDGLKAFEITVGTNDNISVKTSFDFRGVETGKALTPKELAITDAVIRLIQRGYTSFTPAQVFLEYRAATQNTKRRVTPEELRETMQILDKLRTIPTNLDITELLEARGITELNGKMEGEPWLDLHKFAFKKRNQYGEQNVYVYQVKNLPILYRYQKILANGGDHLQQITFNKKLLAIPGKSLTDARIIIGRLLIEHIDLLLNSKNSYKQPTISLERIIKAISADCPNTTPRKAREITEEYLDYYIKIKYITKYTKNNKGKATSSYTITPNKAYKDD